MLILNLAYPERSQIPYKKIRFPDGQQNVVLQNLSFLPQTSPYSVQIRSRLNSWEDLELIVATTQSLRSLHIDIEIELYIPYLLGARSDRKFENGGNHYLKDVIAPVINSQGYVRVLVKDAHSDVTEAVIDNLEKMDNLDLVEWAIHDVYDLTPSSYDLLSSKVVIVSPDAGASKEKIPAVAKALCLTRESIAQAEKHREIATGKLTHISIEPIIQHQGKDFWFIDDVGDGCGTFNGTVEAIWRQLSETRIGNKYLVLTHGIFSAIPRFRKLQEYFTRIYTTNSISDIDLRSESVLDLDFVKQFNVL